MWIRRLLVAAVLAGLAAIFIWRIGGSGDPNRLVGKPAPGFSLGTVNGPQVELQDQKGKVVLLDFWATWCGPCQESLPHTQKLSADKDLADRGLIVWAVNDAEDKDTVDKFLTQNDYTLNVPLDSNGSVMSDYDVRGIPTLVIIGRDQTVKSVFVGYDPNGEKQK